jgi:hypothetical protein
MRIPSPSAADAHSKNFDDRLVAILKFSPPLGRLVRRKNHFRKKAGGLSDTCEAARFKKIYGRQKRPREDYALKFGNIIKSS